MRSHQSVLHVQSEEKENLCLKKIVLLIFCLYKYQRMYVKFAFSTFTF